MIRVLLLKHTICLKSNSNPENNESLITLECLLLRNCPENTVVSERSRRKQRDDSLISMINQPIEEFCPFVKTDVKSNTAIKLSGLRCENDLLQKNVNVLTIIIIIYWFILRKYHLEGWFSSAHYNGYHNLINILITKELIT